MVSGIYPHRPCWDPQPVPPWVRRLETRLGCAARGERIAALRRPGELRP